MAIGHDYDETADALGRTDAQPASEPARNELNATAVSVTQPDGSLKPLDEVLADLAAPSTDEGSAE